MRVAIPMVVKDKINKLSQIRETVRIGISPLEFGLKHQITYNHVSARNRALKNLLYNGIIDNLFNVTSPFFTMLMVQLFHASNL